MIRASTNKEYNTSSKVFCDACAAADIPATARHASKFRNREGKAHKHTKGIK